MITRLYQCIYREQTQLFCTTSTIGCLHMLPNNRQWYCLSLRPHVLWSSSSAATSTSDIRTFASALLNGAVRQKNAAKEENKPQTAANLHYFFLSRTVTASWRSITSFNRAVCVFSNAYKCCGLFTYEHVIGRRGWMAAPTSSLELLRAVTRMSSFALRFRC